MSSLRLVPRRAWHLGFVGCMAVFAAGLAGAQAAPSQDFSSASGYSSSQAGLSASGLQLAEFAPPEAPEPGRFASASAGSAAGQYGGNYSGKKGVFHNWTFEAGGGFNAPFGNDTPYITWGGNFTAGAGIRFSPWLSTLVEYQFMDDKLPGEFIAAASDANGGGITGGSAHINAITGSPVIDLCPKKSNGVYLVGGFGYYHKSTNFSAPEVAFDPFYGYYSVNVTVASFTSNQWGGNAGLGIYHRMTTMYSGESHTQLFAEARYTYIHTPPVTDSNGLGTTEMIPVTVGVRF